MGSKTGISWASSTWNPVTGCSPISRGCLNCYAKTQAARMLAIGQRNYVDGFQVRCHPHMLSKPLDWKKPRNIFVVSMGDLFHEDVPMGFIERVYDSMMEARWHYYMVLTKRASRMKQFLQDHPMYAKFDRVHHGVSVCVQDDVENINKLLVVPGLRRFVSFEPLLEIPKVSEYQMKRIDWAIFGGESGNGARPLPRPVGDVLEFMGQFSENGCKVFFKQFGSVIAKEMGLKSRKGDNPDEWPEEYRVQEYPSTGIEI